MDLAGDLATRDLITLDAPTDSALLWALIRRRYREGSTMDVAVAEVVRDVLAVTTGRLNLLLTDGALVHATRVGNSLFRRGGVIASEPTDDEPGWVEISDHRVTVLTPDGAADAPL